MEQMDGYKISKDSLETEKTYWDRAKILVAISAEVLNHVVSGYWRIKRNRYATKPEELKNMISIDPKDNTERDNYKLLVGSIIPRPIAFVTTQSDAGVVNGAPFSYFNIVSSNPPMVSLSIQRPQGGLKDTARNIYGNGEFVVHIVDGENVEKINETSASLPPSESEVDRVGLTPIPSTAVSIPGIAESKVRMECRLVQAVPFGGDGPGSDLFIGEILQFHVDEAIYENGRIDPRALGAVSRLAGANYATLGEIFELARPK